MEDSIYVPQEPELPPVELPIEALPPENLVIDLDEEQETETEQELELDNSELSDELSSIIEQSSYSTNIEDENDIEEDLTSYPDDENIEDPTSYSSDDLIEDSISYPDDNLPKNPTSYPDDDLLEDPTSYPDDDLTEDPTSYPDDDLIGDPTSYPDDENIEESGSQLINLDDILYLSLFDNYSDTKDESEIDKYSIETEYYPNLSKMPMLLSADYDYLTYEIIVKKFYVVDSSEAILLLEQKNLNPSLLEEIKVLIEDLNLLIEDFKNKEGKPSDFDLSAAEGLATRLYELNEQYEEVYKLNYTAEVESDKSEITESYLKKEDIETSVLQETLRKSYMEESKEDQAKIIQYINEYKKNITIIKTYTFNEEWSKAFGQLNKTLSAVRLTYNSIYLDTIFGEDSYQANLAALDVGLQVHSDIATLSGANPVIGMYNSFYLAPTLEKITGVMGEIVGMKQHQNDQFWNSADKTLIDNIDWRIEPGHEEMNTYLSKIFLSDDVSKIKVPEKVKKYFIQHRDQINSGLYETMPVEGWISKSVGDNFNDWVFENRQIIWAKFYGSRKYPK